MAELVDAADSKSVFARSGSSSLPRGTILRKTLIIKVFFLPVEKIAAFGSSYKNCVRPPP
jgi:hypothetical protein